jgi:hypothetical protein
MSLTNTGQVHGTSVTCLPSVTELTDEDPNTHDMMTILDEEEFVASAVVYPASTGEVQQIVQWANKHRIPIFPISMGRNCKPVSPLPKSLPTTTSPSDNPQWDTAARPPASAAPSPSTWANA